MVHFLRQIHRFWYLLWVFIFFILLYPLYYFSSRDPKYYGILNWGRKINSFLSSLFSGVFYRYTFQQQLSANQTYIFCANHSSNLDIMVFCILGHGRYHFMGKDELLKNPILKIFFESIDITVNRDSKISSFKAFKKAGENLENGMSLVIFPEGKIDDHFPPKLCEFKNGPFRLAIDKNIPLVPVSIIDLWKLNWDNGAKYGSRPGICDIYIHKPIDTTHLTDEDADTLKEEVYQIINSKLIAT